MTQDTLLYFILFLILLIFLFPPPTRCLTPNVPRTKKTTKNIWPLIKRNLSKNEAIFHLTLLCRHFDGIESTEDNPVVMKKGIFVINEDDKPDQHFTVFVQLKIKEHLSSIGYQIEFIHEFTDGCPVQYKSRHCFGSLSLTACNLQCGIIRNFVKTSHAKGQQDAVGGFIERNADFAVLRLRTTIQSAKDLFLICKK